MRRRGLAVLTTAVLALPLVAAACGDEDQTLESLPPIATTTTTTTIPPTTTTIPKTYEVQRNDTLFKIAQKFGLTTDEILAANPKITNPDKIDAGTVLQLPQPAATTTTIAPTTALPPTTRR